MYSQDELNELAEYAKDKLNIEDPYAEFRDEIEEISNESYEQEENKNDEESYVVPRHTPNNDYYQNEYDSVNIRNSMNQEEYDYENSLMEESKVTNDDPILFPGGPTKSQVDSWKNKYKGAGVYIVDVCDNLFVIRTLNRFEYKQIIRQPQLDASQREEVICETTVLFPENYTWKEMAKKDAGIPSTLSQIIMQKSGFTDEYLIERL